MTIPLSLSGKVALITGGSRGIGAATVRMFATAGARVVSNYQKSKADSEKLVKECGENSCTAVLCDLTGTETAREFVDAVVSRFGRLDILVANHGVWPPEDVAIDKMTDEQWRNTMAVNLDSVFALVKYSVAQMKRQVRAGSAAGHIVLISSTKYQFGKKASFSRRQLYQARGVPGVASARPIYAEWTKSTWKNPLGTVTYSVCLPGPKVPVSDW